MAAPAAAVASNSGDADWCPCDSVCSLVTERPPSCSGDVEDAGSNCSAHAHYPAAILGKIDWKESMAGSVKAHTKHVLVAQGSSAARWAEEVTDVADSYSRALDQALKDAKLPIKVRASLSDAQSLDPHSGQSLGDLASEEAAPDAACDLLLFPDMIRVQSVRKDQLGEFAKALGELAQAQIKIGTAAPGSEAASAEAPVLSLPHAQLEGSWFLVCAHKLRDKRCGVAGPILVDEIEKTLSLSYPSTAPPTPVHAVKVSHIGGHKFAGNVIVYPGGVWYGRVLPCHVPHLLLAHVDGIELLDPHSGEKVSAEKAGGAQTQEQKLAPLVRGRVDAFAGKDGKCTVA